MYQYNQYNQQHHQQHHQQHQPAQQQYNYNQANYQNNYPQQQQQYAYPPNQYDQYNNSQYGGYHGDPNMGQQQQQPPFPVQNFQQVQAPAKTQWGESMLQPQIQTFLNQYIPLHLNHENSNYQFNQVQNELQMIKAYSSQYSQNPDLEFALMDQIQNLTKDQKMQTLQELNSGGGVILGQPVPMNLSHLFILLTFAKSSPEQLKKLMSSYPQSLCKYIEKSFQKCMSPDERVFMEHELKSILTRCKEREILFTRDWEVVTTPCLVRESNKSYQQINQIIKDGDQGVIIRVHQQIHSQQQQPHEQPQHYPVDDGKNQSYSFNFQNQQQPQFQNAHSYNPVQPAFYQESKQKNQKLLERVNSHITDDLQWQQKYSRNSPTPTQRKQALIMPSETSSKYDPEPEINNVTIVGTCQNPEKPFFRLTSAPDPTEVRPEEVLHKSLKLISKKWKKQQADYRYIDEQFRSMRQDLTVQRIQTSLTVKIYETHARIALEMADLDQFNQCQTQLHYMYQLKLDGGSYMEFLAYKILYQILCEMDMEVLRTLRQLTDDEKKQDCIIHALNVRKALATGNYGRFFKLYKDAPNMGQYLIGIFIDKHRILCLQKLSFANQNSNLEIQRLSNLLAFEDKAEITKFLTGLECTLMDETHLDCRQSMAKLKNAPLKVKRCQK